MIIFYASSFFETIKRISIHVPYACDVCCSAIRCSFGDLQPQSFDHQDSILGKVRSQYLQDQLKTKPCLVCYFKCMG
jgi:hypothetical protein